MLRKPLCALGAAVLLAGCSTTVPGTPVADPSGVPKPDTGSYATAPRQLGSMTEKMQIAAEAFRMVEIIPLASEVDPALRYGGRPSVGRIGTTVKSTFGDGVGVAVTDMEVGAYISADDKAPGSDATSSRSLITGVFRFKDESAARAAAANPVILSPDKGFASDAPTPKKPETIPGYSEATGYSKTIGDSSSRVGVLASGRYVIVAWTNSSVDLIKKYFDLQVKSLVGFVPTPVDKFSTLPRKDEDLLRLTLVEQSPTVFETTYSPRGFAAFAADTTGAVGDFEATGVDRIANAGNVVYRARDAAGASKLADAFVAENTRFYPTSTSFTVRGVPGGRCLSYPQYTGSKDKRTYCVVPVGRYLAEVSDMQETRAKQALGASYLILRQAK
ncbi:DUF7373 family lipoprotein [Tsukamurella ocularis]|uniref:DUF7373 family lipoprotein n=1 Tax=Tsukamurella ocularis TaxID=1970234 RepID=UPI00216A5E31|nr:hypothetical protein [Tsukamurella ocularis]MCS3778764.1 hypothetical protein [Tsukamurella ocularis]MCS3789465.1 hypothetical protein [Tsukamurella ocularis]MCS3851447.1 hypothetical protein [Tsukamurella ocularis]